MKRFSSQPMTVTGIARRYEALRLIISVALGMLMCIILIFFVTDEPFKAIYYLIVGPFTRYNRLAEVVEPPSRRRQGGRIARSPDDRHGHEPSRESP